MSALYDVYLRARQLNEANPKLSRKQISEALDVPKGFEYDLERVLKAAFYGPALSEQDLVAALRQAEESAPRPGVIESLARDRR